MVAADPLSKCAPVDATQAAPIFAMDAVCVGASAPLIMSQILLATAMAIAAEGIPVRGGAGLMGVPLALCMGLLIKCGGANAIPMANKLR